MAATKRASRVPAKTEPIARDAAVETWSNDTAGIVAINRVGEYGRKQVDLIQGGRVFQITPAERRMNQNAAHDPSLDVFANGTLRAITLIDEEPDTEFLRRNPNTFDDEELPRLFRLPLDKFTDRIGRITNPATTARLVALARDPKWGATYAQFEAATTRDAEVNAANEPKTARRTEGEFRPVTPR